jgi:hypothetical protein
VRDDVTAAAYEGACEKLIAQFKVLWGSMRDAVSGVGVGGGVVGRKGGWDCKGTGQLGT